MRVAYICADPGIPVFGSKGASVHVQEVLRGLLRAGAEVVLFATRFDGEPPPDLVAVKRVALPPSPRGSAAERARAALDAQAELARELDRAVRAGGAFDLVYERYSLWSDAGMAWARAAGCRALLEVNAPLIDEQRAHRELVLPDEATRVARSVFANASALVAVSPGVAAYLERQREARGRIHVVANGVDPTRFDAAAAATRAERAAQPEYLPVIGFLGTLKPWHGLPTLVAAFGLLLEQGLRARLLVVGDGPEREAVQADLAQRGLAEATHFTGAVLPARVPGLLAEMDVAVAPYPALGDFYFSPLKIYEYMAASLPVVASRVGHLEQVVDDEGDGLLVAPEDPQALAAALARLLQDPEARLRLGRAGRARVLRDHSWDAVVGKLLQIAEGAA